MKSTWKELEIGWGECVEKISALGHEQESERLRFGNCTAVLYNIIK